MRKGQVIISPPEQLCEPAMPPPKDCPPPPRVRISVRELSDKPENAGKLNAFLRAWKRIKDLSPDNPNSFWAIGGYHGEPFKPRSMPTPEKDTNQFWGGWCQHANVLFPTWHRFYMLRLEQALRTVCPEDDIAMVYWDETSEASLREGLPSLLTKEKVVIDEIWEDNPLLSFTLPLGISEDEADPNYQKLKGYQTVRYPFSGILSPEKAKLVTEAHNQQLIEQSVDVVKALNDNIIHWLNQGRPGNVNLNSTDSSFKRCLDADSYNTFSNTSSAGSGARLDTSLEDPHNQIHLAVGGFSMGGVSSGQIRGSNGDMGENETAGFDPIFYFHHANVDRMFWIWQKKHGYTDNFVIDPTDSYGTNPSDGQGPTPDQEPNQQLTMDTVLYPFQAPNGEPVTSRDCINIETQMGYTYSVGSLDKERFPIYTPATRPTPMSYHSVVSLDELQDVLKKAEKEHLSPRIAFDVTDVSKWPTESDVFSWVSKPDQPIKFEWNKFSWIGNYILKVHDINRDMYPGSFLIRAYYKIKDAEHFIGQKAVLDRWNRKVCKNCQFHRCATGSFDLKDFVLTWPTHINDFKVEVVYKDPIDGTEKIVDIPSHPTFDPTPRKGAVQETVPFMRLHHVFTATKI